MVSGGQCGFDLEKLEEVTENLSSKLGTAVGDHLLWETKAFEEVIDKELIPTYSASDPPERLPTPPPFVDPVATLIASTPGSQSTTPRGRLRGLTPSSTRPSTPSLLAVNQSLPEEEEDNKAQGTQEDSEHDDLDCSDFEHRLTSEHYDTKLNDWFNCENQPCPNYPEDPRHQPSKQELSEVSFEEEPSAEFQDAQEEPSTEPQHQEEGPLIPEREEEEPFTPITLEQPVTMVNPTNPDNGTRDVVMSDETNQKIPERRINPPSPFTGKKEDLNTFLKDVKLYLKVNKHIYTDDDSKITYLLSFLKGDEASAWKEAWLRSKETDSDIELGTWKDFVAIFKQAFTPINEQEDALQRLKTMTQGKKTAEEHVADFKIVLSKTNLLSKDHANKTEDQRVADAGDTVARDYFQASLNDPLRKKLFDLEKPPRTFKEWTEKAIEKDNNYRRYFALTNKAPAKTSTSTRQWNFSRPTPAKDPMAMDIDAIISKVKGLDQSAGTALEQHIRAIGLGKLSPQERADLIKRGGCFRCRKDGHRSWECPNNSTNNRSAGTSNQNTSNRQNWSFRPKNGKDLYTNIRAAIQEAGEEVVEEFYKELETNQGF
ncbi:hypothetical protein CC2G_002182 [Coprinopsis cinerea AmutBmut pab1-1]|nr:hypothetical protein CC2G_002182 [Coprinopsis cinerea AmutBmut pab1-1]